MTALDVERQNRVKDSDAEFSRSVLAPAIEYSTEEIAKLAGCYGVIGDVSGFGVLFDTRHKLQILDFKFRKEVEQFVGTDDIFIIEQDKYIELDTVGAAFFYRGHDTVERSVSGMVEAIIVMDLFWTIETDAYEEIIFA